MFFTPSPSQNTNQVKRGGILAIRRCSNMISQISAKKRCFKSLSSKNHVHAHQWQAVLVYHKAQPRVLLHVQLSGRPLQSLTKSTGAAHPALQLVLFNEGRTEYIKGQEPWGLRDRQMRKFKSRTKIFDKTATKTKIIFFFWQSL